MQYPILRNEHQEELWKQKLSCPKFAKIWFFSSFYNFDYIDYNNYNDYRDSDLDLDLDWEQFSELVT